MGGPVSKFSLIAFLERRGREETEVNSEFRSDPEALARVCRFQVLRSRFQKLLSTFTYNRKLDI